MGNDIAIESNSYLSFRLGNELFSAHVSKVLNILEMTKITKVPRSPEYMLGVINLRGAVLPVVDTRMKFGIPTSEYTSDTCIIVTDISIDGESVHVGALVDAVQEVLEIEKKEIKPPPSIGSKFKSEFIKGVMKVNEEFIMLLDMDKVFSSDEIISIVDSGFSNEEAEAPVVEEKEISVEDEKKEDVNEGE